ncbi:hypothetical protein VNO78_11503 [Psophocarpus tetragonolobus]|uniref:Uncharacterized protein n=1 Tax=Psophocarpus tetragonolobus TaxID=3891 RepID=A0AAN9XN86_PSOTE
MSTLIQRCMNKIKALTKEDDRTIKDPLEFQQHVVSFFRSIYMELERVQSLCEMAGPAVSSTLGKYLGVPILHYRQKGVEYQYIIDMAQKRMSSWWACNLSFAGRITLVQSPVSAYVKNDVLDVSLLQQFLPSEVINEILNHPYANDELRADHPSWSFTSSREFSTKTSYLLLTKGRIAKVLCQATDKSEIHILWDCNVGHKVWESLKNYQRDVPSRQWSVDLESWVMANLKQTRDRDFHLIFGVTLWSIWNARNEVSMMNKPFCIQNIMQTICRMALEVKNEVIRDENGSWIHCFGQKCIGTVLLAELQAIGTALKIAKEKGMDFMCSSSGNRVADCLAIQLPLGLHIFANPPQGSISMLKHDQPGICLPRRVIV